MGFNIKRYYVDGSCTFNYITYHYSDVGFLMKSVAIIVPTIGSEYLNQCMRSVYNQTYSNIKPYFVIDGICYALKVNDICEEVDFTYDDLVTLPYNVGANGWYGHRIYAAFSFLVNEDYVCFLDEDNWLEPDHVEKMVATIEQNNLDWTHCLRNIYRKDGTFACQDKCESLGNKETWISRRNNDISNPRQCHVDTSSFMVRRESLVNVAGAWYGQWGADRQFFDALRKRFPNWKTTPYHTLNYRLDGNPGSVTEEFFILGNKYMEQLK